MPLRRRDDCQQYAPPAPRAIVATRRVPKYQRALKCEADGQRLTNGCHQLVKLNTPIGAQFFNDPVVNEKSIGCLGRLGFAGLNLR